MPPKKEKNAVVQPDINIKRFNEDVIAILERCQREIKYNIIDGITYSKMVQRVMLKDEPELVRLERFFMEQNINVIKDNVAQGVLPLIATNDMYERILSFIEFTPLSKDIFLVFGQLKNLNFQLTLSFVKIIFMEILRNGRNKSKFYQRVKDIFDNHDDELRSFTNWIQIENQFGNSVVFFLLSLLVSSTNCLSIYVSETDMSVTFDSLKGMYCIHSKQNVLTNDGVKNLYQQILNTNYEITLDEIPFLSGNGQPKSEYNLNVYLVMDARTKKTSIEGAHLLESRNHILLKKYYQLLFHDPTITFMNERNHNYIYNFLYTYLLTFNIFLNAKIRPADKDRYLLAGSVIKSAYNVRDCNDVDFFVLDHEDNIEKYGRYAPNVGVSGIFDDFGKTYYGNEDYYYPMIPKFFEKQKEIKERQRAEDSSGTVKREEKMILNNFPRFSASGLKAGRYVDIYSGECRRIGYDLDNLDELVSNPDYRVYFLGCPLIQLKLEMIRDNIKDIELERVSKKQMHDLHFLKTNYENLFSEMDKIEFDFKKLESRDKVSLPKILLTVNCYHKELQSDQKVGYDFVIRRIPLYMEDITCQMIEECPLLVSRDNEINMGSGKLTYQNPLLSSLPSTVEMEGKRQPIEYYYELSGRGELKIYLMNPGVIPETSFFSDICITGTLKVEILESEKVITISVTGNKMKKIWSQLGTVERKKEYRLALIIFMKNLIQLHKMVDCHTDEKINIKKA